MRQGVRAATPSSSRIARPEAPNTARVSGGLLTAISVAVIGSWGAYILNKKQEMDTRAKVFAELTSQREQAETALRASEERLKGWASDLQEIKRVLETRTGALPLASFASFSAITLRNIVPVDVVEILP